MGTKEQRINDYKSCINMLEDSYNEGVCSLLRRCLIKRGIPHLVDTESILSLYPEFASQEPKRHGIYWWRVEHPFDKKSRIAALKKAISLLETHSIEQQKINEV